MTDVLHVCCMYVCVYMCMFGWPRRNVAATVVSLNENLKPSASSTRSCWPRPSGSTVRSVNRNYIIILAANAVVCTCIYGCVCE
jgi:hypothetical protein